MANQTVTTSVNYDSAAISGFLDGESITKTLAYTGSDLTSIAYS
jgi:hypothetical protein